MGFIDEVAERFTLCEAPCIVHQDLGAALFQVGAVGGDVWRQEDVRHCPEWVVGSQRLLLVDIEACASYFAFAQRVDEVIELQTGVRKETQGSGAKKKDGDEERKDE